MERIIKEEKRMLSNLYDSLSGDGYFNIAEVVNSACIWATPGSSVKVLMHLKTYKFLSTGDSATCDVIDEAMDAIKKWQKTNKFSF